MPMENTIKPTKYMLDMGIKGPIPDNDYLSDEDFELLKNLPVTPYCRGVILSDGTAIKAVRIPDLVVRKTKNKRGDYVKSFNIHNICPECHFEKVCRNTFLHHAPIYFGACGSHKRLDRQCVKFVKTDKEAL